MQRLLPVTGGPTLTCMLLVLGSLGLVTGACAPGAEEKDPVAAGRPAPGAGRSGAGSQSGRSSLVLVTLDTVRPDRLGAYGGAAGNSPSFDSLAADGVLFMQCDSASPLTLPSHATLLTGLYPPDHGLRHNGRGRLAADIPTLASVLSGAGYQAAAFVSSEVLHQRHGLQRGFEIYDDEMAVGGERPADITVDGAIAWLQASPEDEPFFLWVHLYDPHAPYRPPEPYTSAFAERLYEGEIAFADAHLGRLVEAIRTRTRGEAQPVLAVVGDHGEGLGEHGERQHGLLLYQSTLAVPLLIQSRGGEAGRRQAPVRTVDLFPTLLGRLGIAAPAGERPGRDLFAGDTAPGGPGGSSGTGAGGAYAESLMPQADYGWSPLTSYRREGWKMIVGAHVTLHDLERDPAEMTDLLHHRTQQTAAVAESLQAEMARFEWSRSGAASRTGRSPAAGTGTDSLRTLGYLGGTGVRTEGERADPRDRIGFHEEVATVLERYRDARFEEAAALLKPLLDLEPENPFLLDLAGSVQMSLQEPDAAVVFYRRALQAGPERAPLEARLAEALLAAGHLDEAEAAARRALARLPGPPPGRTAYVICHSLATRGQVQDAAQAARAFLDQLAPGDPMAAELQRLAAGADEP